MGLPPFATPPPTYTSSNPPAPPPSTLAALDSASKAIARENFELKMKLFYLEERMEQQADTSPMNGRPRTPLSDQNIVNNASSSPSDDVESQSRIASLQSSLLASKSEVDSLRTSLSARDSLLTKSRKAIENLRSDLRDAERGAARDAKERSDLEASVSSLGLGVATWAKKWEGQAGAVSDLEAANAGLRANLARSEAERRGLEEDLAVANAKVVEGRGKVREVEAGMRKEYEVGGMQVKAELADAKKRLRAAEDERDTLRRERDRGLREAEREEEDRRRWKEERDGERARHDALKAAVEALEKAKGEREKDLEEARRDATKLEAEAGAIEAKASELQASNGRLERERAAAVEGWDSERRLRSDLEERLRSAAREREELASLRERNASLQAGLDRAEAQARANKGGREDADMEARKREGRFRVAMREWETMLDVYLVDFVGSGPSAVPPPQPVPAPPPPAPTPIQEGRNRTPSVEDWKRFMGKGGISRDLGGSVIFGAGDEEANNRSQASSSAKSPKSPLSMYNPSSIQSTPAPVTSPARLTTLAAPNTEADLELDVSSSQFLTRVTAKLRSLSQLKSRFRDEVEEAVRRQQDIFKSLERAVGGAEGKVIGAVDFVRHVQLEVSKNEAARLSELESPRLGAGKRLEEYEKEHDSLLAKEREGEKLKEEVNRLKGELEKTSGELRTLTEQHELATKAIAAGRSAVDSALKRTSQILADRDALSAENNGLNRALRAAEADRDRLFEACERLRGATGIISSPLTPGMMTHGMTSARTPLRTGVDLSRFASADPVSAMKGGMVEDDIVQRELMKTRELLDRKGQPSASELADRERETSFLRSAPTRDVVASSPARAYIAPPREEQERRARVRSELDGKLREIKAIVARIEEAAGRAEQALAKFEAARGGVSGKRMGELEGEVYSLLDSNARIAVQMQQMGLDMARVYRRFKALEIGEGGERSRKTSGRRKPQAPETPTGVDPRHVEDMRKAYSDLQAGVDLLEGEEKIKAEKILQGMARDMGGEGGGGRGGGGGGDGGREKMTKKIMTPESEERLKSIGEDLREVQERLNVGL